MGKHHFSSLGEIVTYCTSENLPFALYALPEENQIHCITQDSAAAALEDNSSLPSAAGFILYPFKYSKESPAYFIRADNKYSFLKEDITNADLSDNYQFNTGLISNIETKENVYSAKVKEAVSTINKGEFQKVILSRIQGIETRISPVAAFIDLFKKYPSAFVSLVYIPGKTLWLTATPELLLSSNKEEVKTVALAGTKKAGEGHWRDKEREEQRMVSDYIKAILDDNCLNVVMDGPHEITAGNIAHLKTSFTAKLDAGLWQLVSDLHPTPAVCGLPKDKALEFITKTELHKRKYYSGFLGPCNINGETDLFVNLRCAELSGNKADLYIGGGITANSDPKAEWKETVMKAETLLSVLKPILADKLV